MTFIKGQRAWNKGIKTGLVPKSVFKKGQVPWNKGLHIRTCLTTPFLKGHIPWNKNKKYNDEEKKKLNLLNFLQDEILLESINKRSLGF